MVDGFGSKLILRARTTRIRAYRYAPPVIIGMSVSIKGPHIIARMDSSRGRWCTDVGRKRTASGVSPGTQWNEGTTAVIIGPVGI